MIAILKYILESVSKIWWAKLNSWLITSACSLRTINYNQLQPILYWRSAYDVIKNLIKQIIINLPQILIWPIRPCSLSLYHIWTYLDQWKQIYGDVLISCNLLFIGGLHYDVNKNLIKQIRINLLQILIWPIRPYSLSLYHIWTYLDQWKQIYGPKKLENFLLCYMRKWVGGHSFAHEYGCHNISV